MNDKTSLFISWHPKLSVGIESIDNQHKKLIQIINELFEQVFSQDIKNDPIPILNKLKEFAIEHFAYEEELFDKYGWENTKQHKEQHQLLLEEIDGIELNIKNIKEKSTNLIILELLKIWTGEHLMDDDQQYSKFLIEKGVK